MNNFDKTYLKILENMTTGSVFGANQAHPPETGQSSDFYAPGDARIPHILGAKKGKKRKAKVIRRTFPKTL
jgi:hypothetical protein